MSDWVVDGISAGLSVLGLAQAAALAQIVVEGEGLDWPAQLALVVGLVVVQLVAVVLLHQRRS